MDEKVSEESAGVTSHMNYGQKEGGKKGRDHAFSEESKQHFDTFDFPKLSDFSDFRSPTLLFGFLSSSGWRNVGITEHFCSCPRALGLTNNVVPLKRPACVSARQLSKSFQSGPKITIK